jgi:soluble lytic murein transglycosylase-like protein
MAGPIYVYKQPDGTIKFSSKPPLQGTEAKVFTASKPGFSYYGTKRKVPMFSRQGKLQTTLYSNYIREASQRFSIPPDLIRAVIHAESAFNPTAISPKGARGLMQLMPDTMKQHGVRDAFSPAQNIYGGTRHLAYLVKKLKGNLQLVLAAYNAGLGAVQQYGGIPPYSETRQYVQRVLSLRARYRSALNKY